MLTGASHTLNKPVREEFAPRGTPLPPIARLSPPRLPFRYVTAQRSLPNVSSDPPA